MSFEFTIGSGFPVAPGLILCAVLYPVAVLLHELGHALAGFAVGLRVARISIGRFGTRIFRIRMFNCAFELRSIPYGGLTTMWFKSARHARFKWFSSTLCGPVVTILLMLGSLTVVAVQKHGTLASASRMFAAVNLILFVQILIPRKLTIDSRQTCSDFLLMKQTLSAPDVEIADWVFGRFYCEAADCQERGEFAEAEKWLLQGLRERPNDLTCLCELGYVQYALRNVDAAGQMWTRWLELAPKNSIERPYILNAIATSRLGGGLDDLDEAERFTSEAIAAMPWAPDFRETRDRVLAARNLLKTASNTASG
ncbi:MAG: site-2 protease family protein [Deltaproteobacteria bacterium]